MSKSKAIKDKKMPKKRPPAYRGFTGVNSKKEREAIDGLYDLIEELSGVRHQPCYTVKIFGVYREARTVETKWADAKKAQLWCINTIAITDGDHIGASFPAAAPSYMGLIYAAEKYLEKFHSKPHKPIGWSTGIVGKADAEFGLKANWHSLDKEETTLAPQPADAPRPPGDQDALLALSLYGCFEYKGRTIKPKDPNFPARPPFVVVDMGEFASIEEAMAVCYSADEHEGAGRGS